MDNSFEITIAYNGKEYLFPASLITYGYSYRIEANIFDTLVNFEPDEEGNYRALIDPGEMVAGKITKELLQLIVEQLGSLFRDSK